MFRNIRIGTKILIITLLTSLTALFILATTSYIEMLNLTQYSQGANIKLGVTASSESQEALLTQAEEYLQKLTVEQARNANTIFAHVQNELVSARDYVERIYAAPQRFVGIDLPLPQFTENGKPSSKYMTAPGVVMTKEIQDEVKLLSNAEHMLAALLANNKTYTNMYIGTKTGISYRYSSSNNYNPEYDPRARSWYILAMANQRNVIWLDTYRDPFGFTVITASIAFYNAEKKIHGVIATDVTLESLNKYIIKTKIGVGGYAFLLDKDTYVVHPKYKEKGFVKTPLSSSDESFVKVLHAMADNQTGLAIALLDGSDNYVAYAPLESVGWSFGISVPISEVTLASKEIKKQIDTYTNEAQKFIHETLSEILMSFIIIFAICAIILVFCSFVFSKTITKPISNLVKHTRSIGNGNLDNIIENTSNDEIGQLARAFNRMSQNLKLYIENLSAAIKEKEHINSELTVAANIQNDMLPCIFPVYSNLEYARICAKMIPAKEVGGDFYDVFFIDEQKTKLCCLVADVSGKGVPASLFMVITKTILKSHLSNTDILSAIKQSNNLLAADNNSCMFVTVFVAILDFKTGKLEFVNCGHNPPLLYRKGTSFEFMEIIHSLPLAVMEDVPYQRQEINLDLGDIIYMYTDGINEAMNIDGDIFSDNTLLDALNSIKDRKDINPEMIDTFIRKEVQTFAGEAEQSDDMTTFVLQYTQTLKD